MSDQIGNLAKAAQLLRAVAAAGSEGATVAKLAASSGVSRPSAHRVCAKLEGIGWIERYGKKICLGPELALLGLAALQRFPLEALARPYMEDLSRKTGQTISLMQRVGDEAICIGRVEGAGHIRALLLEVGSRWPLGKGAAGMAILAALPEPEAETILKKNAHLIVDEPEESLHDRLTAARSKGHAAHTGLVLSGVSGLAAPIFDTADNVVASVSVAFVANWMEPDALETCRSGIPKLAQSITNRLSKHE